MKIAAATLALLFLAFAAAAQSPNEALAAIGGRTITAQDLEPQIAEIWNRLPGALRETRTALLEQLIDEKVLELEAEKLGSTPDALIDSEVTRKIGGTSESRIKAVYDENKEQIGNVPLERVRDDIIEYLRRESERERYREYVGGLRKSRQITIGKDINTPDLRGSDTVATIDGKTILYLEYQRANGLTLYELEANAVDTVLEQLKQVIDAAVFSSEAESLGLATSEFIAREITDKMKDFSETERERLASELRKKLYEKYRVIVFVKEPAPFIQAVSVDDDPSIGRADAKVTVVMFTDFQCPACAGVDPILKRVVKDYGNSVRLVVRDFPLTSIHENAFSAAVAAGAAEKQGKFFEYTQLLYNNQEALDKESLSRYADIAGLDLRRFERDIADAKLADEVRKDIEDGKSYGVSGTPSVYVNGYKIRTLAESSFRKAIDRALGK